MKVAFFSETGNNQRYPRDFPNARTEGAGCLALDAPMCSLNPSTKERLDNEFNLPIGSVPLYLRQIDEKGTEEDLLNISTGKIIKKWSKKKKGKKKLEEIVLKQNHNMD